VGGVNNTTAASYIWQRLLGSGASPSSSTSATDYWDVVSQNTNQVLWSADIFAPALAVRTGFLSLGFRTSGETNWVGGGSHTQTVAYDGFDFFPASGTITGTIFVYGYKI